MSEIKSKATVMKGLQFAKEEKKRNLVRVQIKDFDKQGLKVRKWNYKTKAWGKWAALG